MTRRQAPVGTASTTRLRKVECDHGCGMIARVSRSAMLRGLMACPCGGSMVPAALEDAMALHAAGLLSADQLAVHGEYMEWQRQLSSIAHGQASHGLRGRTVRPAEELAHQRLMADRRAEAL